MRGRSDSDVWMLDVRKEKEKNILFIGSSCMKGQNCNMRIRNDGFELLDPAFC
jgi:hypothetical protein